MVDCRKQQKNLRPKCDFPSLFWLTSPGGKIARLSIGGGWGGEREREKAEKNPCEMYSQLLRTLARSLGLPPQHGGQGRT